MKRADPVAVLSQVVLLAACAALTAGCEGDKISLPEPVNIILTEPNDSNAFYSDRHSQCAYRTSVTDLVTPDPDRFEARRATGSRIDMNYRLFVPEGYDAARSYPLVLLLHGGGARGPDNDLQLAGVAPYLFSSPEIQSEHPSFVVAPKVADPDGSWASLDRADLSDNLYTGSNTQFTH